MEVNPTAGVLGVYAGLVTLGLVRGTVKLSVNLLLDLAKLSALGLAMTFMCCAPFLTLMVLAGSGFCLYRNLPSPHLPAAGKAVFITGCDRGLGHQLAVVLDSLGMYVFAGCLFPGGEGETSLKSKCSKRLCTVPLDVSDPENIKEAAALVKKELKERELWGVVNNAGILYAGCLEVMTDSDIKRMIDVNLMGQLHTIRAFLPLLRASHGRLVNIASNTGLAPVPLSATYCASKAGVAILSESLRLELKPWGISVSTIIPSGYRTGILLYDRKLVGDRWWEAASEEVKESYGQECFYLENIKKDYVSMLNADFSGIVQEMVHALLEKSPKAFYYKGFLARSLPFLYQHLPTSVGDLIMPSLTWWYKFDPPALRKQAPSHKGD